MSVKVELEGFDVISSGIVITNKNEDIVRFFIEDLTIEIQFMDDETKGLEIEPEKPVDKKVRIKFINFNNPLGTGSLEPIKLGTINKQDLYFNYRVKSFDGDKGVSGKTLYYTWTLKKKDE